MLTVWKANEALNYINSKIVSRSKEVVISLDLVQIRPHLEPFIQFWVPHTQDRRWSTGANSVETYQDGWRQEPMPCEEIQRK